MAVHGKFLGRVQSPMARMNLAYLYELVSKSGAAGYPYAWAARDDANLLDANGDYASRAISTPGTIRRIVLQACHNAPDITFALEKLA